MNGYRRGSEHGAAPRRLCRAPGWRCQGTRQRCGLRLQPASGVAPQAAERSTLRRAPRTQRRLGEPATACACYRTATTVPRYQVPGQSERRVSIGSIQAAGPLSVSLLWRLKRAEGKENSYRKGLVSATTSSILLLSSDAKTRSPQGDHKLILC